MPRPMPSLTFDRDFRITYANPQALRVSQLWLPMARSAGSTGTCARQTRGTIVEENLLAAMRDRDPRQFEYFSTPVDLWMDVLVLTLRRRVGRLL